MPLSFAVAAAELAPLPERQRLVAIAIADGLFLLVFELIRRRKLREEYAWVWLLTAAGLMMLALMTLVLALGLTGFLQTTDLFWGEEWLEELHAGLATTLIALAGIHAAAAIVIGRLERVNLVGAMITGVKRTRNGRVDVR